MPSPTRNRIGAAAVAGALLITGCGAGSARFGGSLEQAEVHSHPPGVLVHLREGDALVDLADVEASGDGYVGRVAEVYFDGPDPWLITAGQEVRFKQLRGAEKIDLNALDAWHVVLLDLTHGEGSAPDFYATLAIDPSGKATQPQDLREEFTNGIVARMGEPFSGRTLGRLLGEAAANPKAPPAALRYPTRDDQWHALPPEARELGPDDAPADVLANQTVPGVLRIDIPADMVAAARADSEHWVLTVVQPQLGILYSTEVSVGSHEMPVYFPAGTLQVRLRTDRRAARVVHVLGGLASPVTSANGRLTKTSGTFTVRVRWRDTPRPASTWVGSNPAKLA